jgi:hypothetical protein
MHPLTEQKGARKGVFRIPERGQPMVWCGSHAILFIHFPPVGPAPPAPPPDARPRATGTTSPFPACSLPVGWQPMNGRAVPWGINIPQLTTHPLLPRLMGRDPHPQWTASRMTERRMDEMPVLVRISRGVLLVAPCRIPETGFSFQHKPTVDERRCRPDPSSPSADNARRRLSLGLGEPPVPEPATARSCE